MMMIAIFLLVACALILLFRKPLSVFVRKRSVKHWYPVGTRVWSGLVVAAHRDDGIILFDPATQEERLMAYDEFVAH